MSTCVKVDESTTDADGATPDAAARPAHRARRAPSRRSRLEATRRRVIMTIQFICYNINNPYFWDAFVTMSICAS